MKVRLSILAAFCAAFFTGAPPALGDSPGGSDGSATDYYLSLGDSLADRGGNPEDYQDAGVGGKVSRSKPGDRKVGGLRHFWPLVLWVDPEFA